VKGPLHNCVSEISALCFLESSSTRSGNNGVKILRQARVVRRALPVPAATRYNIYHITVSLSISLSFFAFRQSFQICHSGLESVSQALQTAHLLHTNSTISFKNPLASKMGRWTYSKSVTMPSSSTQADIVEAVFGGDPDMCVIVWIEKKVGVSIHDSPERLEEARRKLDAGFGAKLMKVFRSKEANEMWGMQFMQDQKYTTLMLGAYMMHVGGKILPEDREHLKACFEKFPGKNGYVFCMGDDAFRSAGKVQYGAALEHYIDGKPRSFLEPR